MCAVPSSLPFNSALMLEPPDVGFADVCLHRFSNNLVLFALVASETGECGKFHSKVPISARLESLPTAVQF